MTEKQEIETRYSLTLHTRRGISLNRGQNCTVWDENGKEYLDCTSGQGVALLGHSHPEIVDALARQAGILMTCTGSFYNDTRAELLEKLVEITPSNLNRAFLCNSGTESIEAAIKFTRSTSPKREFIAAMRGFHGRTMGSLSATFTPDYREPFEPLVPGFTFVPFNNFEKLEAQVTEDTAGIILEVVQGEGGVHIGDKTYFNQVAKLCCDRDIILIIDEVQTGFGRTGKLFACEHFDVQPDLLCLSKGIAAGFPMGAVLCSDKIKVSIGQHGTTFGGNPLACTVSLASIDCILKNDLPAKAAEIGAYFMSRFSENHLPIVREVRQIGLMIGIEIRTKAQPFISKLQEEGILVLPAGKNVIRLLPPLTISTAEIDRIAIALHSVLSEEELTTLN